MTKNIRFCLSGPLKWKFIYSKLNIISRAKRVADTAVVIDLTCTRQNVITLVVNQDCLPIYLVDHKLLKPPIILLMAVPRRLFCSNSLVILDVVCRFLSLFLLYINTKIDAKC